MQTPGVCLLCECAWYSLSALFEVTRSHSHPCLGQTYQGCSNIFPTASSCTPYCVNEYETVRVDFILLGEEALVTVKETSRYFHTSFFCQDNQSFYCYFQNTFPLIQPFPMTASAALRVTGVAEAYPNGQWAKAGLQPALQGFKVKKIK